METIALPHLLDHPLRVILFTHVQNAAFLRQQLLDGNTGFEYAFLDASTLLSRKHVLAACFRAINDSLHGRLKSRNVHSEIVFSLSPNNNIADSFRRFGIQPTTPNILAIRVGSANDHPDQTSQHLLQNVQGEPTPFTDEVLAGMCDYARIKKIYRVDVSLKGDVEAARREAEAFVLGAMALKGS